MNTSYSTDYKLKDFAELSGVSVDCTVFVSIKNK